MTNSPMPEYLSATPDDSPCDGSHGRFCPECAAINRWADQVKLDIDTFTAEVAIQIFMLETDTDWFTAWACLPAPSSKEIGTRRRRTSPPAHHRITRAELKLAIETYLAS